MSDNLVAGEALNHVEDEISAAAPVENKQTENQPTNHQRDHQFNQFHQFRKCFVIVWNPRNYVLEADLQGPVLCK